MAEDAKYGNHYVDAFDSKAAVIAYLEQRHVELFPDCRTTLPTQVEDGDDRILMYIHGMWCRSAARARVQTVKSVRSGEQFLTYNC